MVAIAVLAGTAAADPPKPKGPQPYRSFIMLSDGFAAAFTAGFAALAYRNRDCDCEDFSGEGVIFGLMFYGSFPVFAHHDAGHDGRAVASGALRVGLPIAAGAFAYHEGASSDESLVWAGAGMVGAMVIDWFALSEWSYEPKDDTVGVYVAPATGGSGVVAGIGGAFD